MSFVSVSDSVIVMRINAIKPDHTIAHELKKIAQGFKLKVSALEKVGLVEGTMRWLQYTFHKKAGGGFIYITRRENWVVYLVIFNLKYETISMDLPYIDRYVKQLQLTDEAS